VLTILAFVHGDQSARGLLHDPRILQENLSGAVQTANEIHTSAARQYIEWIAANHPGATVQQSVNAALAGVVAQVSGVGKAMPATRAGVADW